MIKQFTAGVLTIILAAQSIVMIPSVSALATNEQSVPWTREKAEHLARKVYFAATNERVDALYAAGSAAAAADIVFPNATGPDRTAYNAEITGLTASGFNWADGGHASRLYQYRYARDPYESKAKLFSLFEDIFPVNNNDKILYRDIIDQHDLLYSHALGNYREMIKKQLFTNGGKGDYAMGKFLDLLDQTDFKNPNENYGRELIQLFMMGEYKPGESKELGSVRNYEERDVAAIARILTGFVSNTSTHQVSYDATKHNTSTGVLFLSGAIKPGVSFGFMNASGALDLGAMATPINGNNGLGDNAIDYIFAMREEAIALFLADRLYRVYVDGKPARANLDTFASVIVANNFEILPSLKWLLASDMMYSESSMNGLTYKNPLELTIGTIKLLHRDTPGVIDPMLRDTSLLGRLNWTPFFPGSVFGRDGFDDNAKFYSTYIQNQWISYASRVAFDSTAGSYLLSEVIPQTTLPITTPTAIVTSTGNTLTGSLTIANAQINLLAGSGATGTGATATGVLILTGGAVTLPAVTITTASGVISITDGIYDPTNFTLTIRAGALTQGALITPVDISTITFTPASTLSRDITPLELFEQIEDRLVLGRRLLPDTKARMTAYLQTNADGSPAVFRPSLPAQANKLRAIIAMYLTQPEFVLQTGIDRPVVNETLTQSVLGNATGKLLLVELGGGYDWLHGVIPKSEYADYIAKRTNTDGTIAIDANHVTDLGDFYMNSALATGSGGVPSLKSLYDSNNLRIFNRVGTTDHSRDHDQAQKQIASYLSSTDDEADGVFGQLIRYEPNSDSTISLSGRRPNVFRGGRYINIGPSGAIFSNGYLNTADRTAYFNTLRGIAQNRTYPDRTADLFKAAVKVDQIAQLSKTAGGPDGAGYGNVNNLKFLKTLLANDAGKTFYMQADGGYDTHSQQLAPQSNFDAMNIPKDLNYNIGRVMSNLTGFFNEVKATEDITIVVFSEFGRTIEINGDLGTDHGEGGGMFVMSNNVPLLSSLNQKVYGNVSIKNAEENWLGVGIDYRSVYGKIYNALYGVSDTAHFGTVNNLARDVSTTPARLALTRTEYRSNNDWNARVTQKFTVEGENFDSKKASHITVTRPKDPNAATLVMEPVNTWEIHNYVRKPLNRFEIGRDWISEGRAYSITYKAYTNQYIETARAVTLRVPVVVASNQPTQVTGTGNLIFRRFDNTTVPTTGVTLAGSGIILANTVGTGALQTVLRSADGVEITMATGATLVTTVTSASGSAKWYGGFVMGESIDPNSFISEEATLSGAKLLGQNVERVVRVGADTLGVGMTLSRPVTIGIPAPVNAEYRVITSEDGINWSPVSTSAVNSGASGRVSFETAHFSYFALVSAAAPVAPTCTITASNMSPLNGTPVTLSWSSMNATSASISGLGGQALAGSISVTPTADTGTAYTMTLTGNSGLTGNCQVIVTAVGMPAPSTGGSGTGGGGGSSSGGGGGGGGSANTGAPAVGGSGIPAGNPFTADVCPAGDLSPSLFDGRCSALPILNTGVTPVTSMTPASSTPIVTMTSTTPTKPGRVKPVRKPITRWTTVRPVTTPTTPKTPIVPKAQSRVPTVKPTVVYSQTTPAPDTASKLRDITLYSEPAFDTYDWTQDRRLPIEIYAVIDTRIANLEKLLLKDRARLDREITDLLVFIAGELAKPGKTAREIGILKYVQNELVILQTLYRKPRVL